MQLIFNNKSNIIYSKLKNIKSIKYTCTSIKFMRKYTQNHIGDYLEINMI